MKNRFRGFSFNKILLMVSDIIFIAISGLISYFVYMATHGVISNLNLAASTLLGCFCCFCTMFILGCYNNVWRFFKLKDYIKCIISVILGFILVNLIVYVLNDGVSPTPFYYTYATVTCIVLTVFRFVFKFTFINISNAGRLEANVKRTMIIGAGRACSMIIDEIHNARDRDSDNQLAIFEPVCIVDDDRRKVGTKIRGVSVVGTTDSIAEIAKVERIEQILFAIPSCSGDDRARILNICSSTDLPVRIIPFIGNLIADSENSMLGRIRDVNIDDLLGRKPISFDSVGIKEFVQGKVCMVTGGGGSIGSEIVRQLAKYDPKKIVIVDIYENNAYDIQQELRMEYGEKLNFVTLIASVRDYVRMDQIFKKYRPEIVLHAAAHKHVPLMEKSPAEAIKNNVIGTFNVATLALAHNVSKFVMISTDKAVNPTNVMGASKRCCEMIIQYLAQQPDCKTEFVTTRFGNVLGSNGSVIPLFKRQIEQGKPLTVTHPDIIRYFMTIPEAVNLVLEAAVLAKGGEIFVLDMGKPVKIVTLAENLIRMYGKRPYKDVQIVFTGLRPGEKIKEELLMNEEGLTKTSNELIFIGKHIELDEDSFINDIHSIKYAANRNDEEEVVAALHRIVPTFVLPEEYNTKELMKM